MSSSPTRPFSARRSDRQITDGYWGAEEPGNEQHLVKPKRVGGGYFYPALPQLKGTISLVDVQANLNYLREELCESFTEQQVWRQELMKNIKRELSDQCQNIKIKLEHHSREEMRQSFKNELGELARQVFREELCLHVHAMQEAMLKISCQFREAFSETQIGMAEALRTNGKTMDMLAQMQNSRFDETMVTFKAELLADMEANGSHVEPETSRFCQQLEQIDRIETQHSHLSEQLDRMEVVQQKLQDGQLMLKNTIEHTSMNFSPLLEAIRGEFNSLAIRGEINSLTNRPQQVAAIEKIDLSPVLEAIRTESRNTTEAIEQAKNFVAAHVEAAIANCTSERPDLSPVLEAIRSESRNTAAAIEEAKHFVPPQVVAAIGNSCNAPADLSPVLELIRSETRNTAAAIEQAKHFVPPQVEAAIANRSGERADLSPVLEAIHSESRNTAAAIEQAKHFVPPQVVAALGNTRSMERSDLSSVFGANHNRSGEKADLSPVLEAIHSESRNIAVAIEQVKSFVPPQVVAAIASRGGERADLSPVLEAIHSESRNTTAAIDQIRHFVSAIANRSGERADLSPVLEAIHSESRNTTAAIDQMKHFVSALANRRGERVDVSRDSLDLGRFEQILVAIRASLEVIQGHQVSISSNLDVVVRKGAHSRSLDDSFEYTMRRHEMVEPTAALTSSRISGALSNVSKDLAQHRSDCRMVWETQDLTLAEVKQALKALQASASVHSDSKDFMQLRAECREAREKHDLALATIRQELQVRHASGVVRGMDGEALAALAQHRSDCKMAWRNQEVALAEVNSVLREAVHASAETIRQELQVAHASGTMRGTDKEALAALVQHRSDCKMAWRNQEVALAEVNSALQEALQASAIVHRHGADLAQAPV